MLDINNYRIMIKDFESMYETRNVLIKYTPGYNTSSLVDFGEDEDSIEVLESTNTLTGEKELSSEIPIEDWYEELLEIAREIFTQDLMDEDDIYQYAVEKEEEEDDYAAGDSNPLWY